MNPNNKLIDLEKESGVNLALLMTGAIGIDEGGEFSEIVKCIQGKPFDDETIYCKRELGDIMWYWINSRVWLGPK